MKPVFNSNRLTTRDKIINKLRQKKKLTRKEEFIYMTEAIGMTAHEVKTIFSIADNKNAFVFID
jgi:hypothetical protein